MNRDCYRAHASHGVVAEREVVTDLFETTQERNQLVHRIIIPRRKDGRLRQRSSVTPERHSVTRRSQSTRGLTVSDSTDS
jgi:hypothetical protein